MVEERAWRAAQTRKPAGWVSPSTQVLTPQRIVVLYRQLRKALEDAKDEPGAADFYYGEMEMRRHSASRWGERFILTLYWLFSGYAQRASRAVAALAVLVVLSTGLLVTTGLPTRPAETRTVGLVRPIGRGAAVELTQRPSAAALDGPLGEHWTWRRTEQAARTSLNAVVFRRTEQQLTVWGRYTELVARIIGPILLALAVLAVRNRVKR